MNRRGFLASMLALGMAPAIVRAENIMRVRPVFASSAAYTDVFDRIVGELTTARVDTFLAAAGFRVADVVRFTGDGVPRNMLITAVDSDSVTIIPLDASRAPRRIDLQAMAGIKPLPKLVWTPQ